MNACSAAGSKEELIETGSKFRAEGDAFLGTNPTDHANRGVINHTCSFQEKIYTEKKWSLFKSIFCVCVGSADLSCITHKAMPVKPTSAIYFPADLPDISSSKLTQRWILVMECNGIMPTFFFSFFFYGLNGMLNNNNSPQPTPTHPHNKILMFSPLQT